MFDNLIKKTLLLATTSAFLFPIFPSTAAIAKTSIDYQYFVGSGNFCSLEPTACPDIAMASNGDRVEITGMGTFNTGTGSTTGGGTFVHKDSAGNVKGSGTWTALGLVSFRSYGNGTPQGLPANFEGGRAKLRVHLAPSSGGPGFDADLKIICLLGDPPKGKEEGVRLTVRRGPKFQEQVSGDTLFIRLP